MHHSNPFFNRETHERREPSPGPTSTAPSQGQSTNPFRRAKRTTMPTGHEDTDNPNAGHTNNECSSPDLPTTSSPDPDREITDLAATAGTSPSTAMPDSLQESTSSQRDSASTNTALGSATPAAGRFPVNIRARRAGRRGLNLHVHWGDQDAAASSSSTPAPPQDEQPAETPDQQPLSPATDSPSNPPNQPPTAQSAPNPGASQPSNNMFFIQ